MVHGNGNLGGRQVEVLDEVEHLHVEGESIDDGTAEDLLCGLSGETLEAALRVAVAAEQHEAGE